MAFTSNPQSIADLLPAPALDDVKAFLLGYLSVPQNAIDDWNPGAVLRTMWKLESMIIQDLVGGALPQLLANGYPDTASGDSLTKVAHGWFAVERALSGVATQTVTLSCDAAHGPYSTAQVAPLIGLTTDGALYSITAGAAPLSSGGSISVTFTAQTPGAARGLIAGLTNALAGVTVTAAAIATFGSNGDDDPTVQAAIDSRFPDLSALPALDRTAVWALAAAPPPLVTRYRLDADPAIPGGVLITLANAGGAVAGGTVTAVQAALDLLSPITDNNTAQNSTAANITAHGTVRVKAALLAGAQTAANNAWVTYLAGAQIGATVYLEQLSRIVGDAIKLDPGSNFTGQSLTTSAGSIVNGNVVLPSTGVPVPAGSLTAELVWVAT